MYISCVPTSDTGCTVMSDRPAFYHSEHDHLTLKVGFHYPSSRPEFTGRQLGPWTRVVETDLNSPLCILTTLPLTIILVILKLTFMPFFYKPSFQTSSPLDDHFVGQTSAVGQPTWPTQPSISRPSGVGK